jgi:hypothetical protein
MIWHGKANCNLDTPKPGGRWRYSHPDAGIGLA